MCDITTVDFYRDFSENAAEKFYTSNYEKNHPSGIPTRLKKAIGMFKDEAGRGIISEVCGLKPNENH